MFPSAARAIYRSGPGTRAPLALLRAAIDDVVSRRRLIRYLVAADMKKRGSDTALGNLWWILDPLLQMMVYVVFITIVAQRPQPDYPLFIFSAILPFKWYTSVITDSTASVVRQERLIRQIAFPKIVLPISTATAEVVGFVWGFIPLLAIMLFYIDRLTPYVLFVPLIAMVQYVFSLASAIFVSAANVFFRDLGNIVGHLLRLWWFLSPGLYSIDNLGNVAFFKEHHSLIAIAHLNPFAVLFEAYRSAIYGTATGGPPRTPDLGSLAGLLVASVILTMLAAVFFKRVEPSFTKAL
ncbi:MAG TPA: ABC transporter permease [Candidatus Limnocylindrales bacterium]|nr:ABC transporter permease [Candidatus Limnocylindrales bacterium]